MSVVLESYAFRTAVAPQYFEALQTSCTWVQPFLDSVSGFMKKLHVENALDKDMAGDEDWEQWMNEM